MISFRRLRRVFACLLMFGAVVICGAQSSPIKRSSNVRKTASRTSAIVGTLDAGDSVTVVSGQASGEYTEVKTSDGTDGWVLTKNIGRATLAVKTKAPAANGDFTQSCDAPQFPSTEATAIDGVCPVQGTGGKEANQNMAKNNFCATGRVQMVTVADMVALQKQVPASVPFGQKTGPAIDRSALQALGEGDEVTVSGYISYTSQEGAESVNCGKTVSTDATDPLYHDIHMNLVSTKGAAQCTGVVAELIPHHRPAEWNAAAVKAVMTAGLLVRVTGNRMFDSSHSPCAGGKAASGDPARASLWEVHPIYKFEVCPSGTCASGGWVELEAWKP